MHDSPLRSLEGISREFHRMLCWCCEHILWGDAQAAGNRQSHVPASTARIYALARRMRSLLWLICLHGMGENIWNAEVIATWLQCIANVIAVSLQYKLFT